ncbi:MAG: response regulator [Bacteroidota bacterium]
MTELILIDDHEIFRNGLKVLLEASGDYRVIGEASNGEEALDLLKLITPDLILMDIHMPGMNGLELSKRVMEKYATMNILILSMYDDKQYYEKLIDNGVKGFILKDSNFDELQTAINRINAGSTYFSQELLLKLVNEKKQNPEDAFTSREMEILQLLAKGLSTQEIADQLYISFRTVERHRANLLTKTNTNNSLKLLVYAIKHNLVRI